MKRRELITLLGAAAAWPLAARAQQAERRRTVGFLRADRPPAPWMDAFQKALRELGYGEGKNIFIEYRWAGGDDARLPDLAGDLVRLNVDVIVASGTTAIIAAKKATTSIPIVGPTADPVVIGFTSSLARPDRNFTGVMLDAGLEIWAKRVQLLLEAARKVTKLGYLIANPTTPTASTYIREAAQRGGIATAYIVIAGNFDRAAIERNWAAVIVGGEKVDRTACERTFAAMEKEGVDGLIVGEQVELLAYRELIADLAARFRVPAIYPYREFVEVGGLMAYGVDVADTMRRVAWMTGQMLGGAKPSDIPIYQQNKYELVLNQKAATSLGLEFPATLLTAADAVVD